MNYASLLQESDLMKRTLLASSSFKNINSNSNDIDVVEHLDDKTIKIVILLDESGSMSNLKSKMILSINQLINDQKKIEGTPVSFSFIKFSDNVKRVVTNKKLEEVSELTSCDYNPSGSTALYDAIGSTISYFRNEKNVMLVIVTDGEENSSKKYNDFSVKNMLEQKKIDNDWTYVYLGNNLHVKKQGEHIGLVDSKTSKNCVRGMEHYGSFISSDFNNALGQQRKGFGMAQSFLH